MPVEPSASISELRLVKGEAKSVLSRRKRPKQKKQDDKEKSVKIDIRV